MPLQRNQPSPDRQSVLSFVSPNVADLLFYETVDAKTVGAGSGKTLTDSAKSTANLSSETAEGQDSQVAGGQHTDGFTVSFTSTAHGFVVGDVVVIKDVGCSGVSLNGRHKITVKTDNAFTVFVKDDPSTISFTSDSRAYKSHPNYGTAHPDTENFPRHKLCYVKQADGEGLYFEYYYAADRLHQDDYNFEFSQADLGGNKYDTVVRTYVTLRADFKEADTKYNAGDRMPDVPDAKFPDNTYILMTRQQKRIGDAELDGLFVVEQRVYFNRVDIVTHNLDPATDGVLAMVEKVVYRGETFDPPNGSPDTGNIEALAEQADDELWGLDDDGRNWEVEQLSNDWWKVTIQDVIPQGLSALYGGKVIRDYDTWQNFTWPAVVGSLTFTTANKKDGSSQTALTIRNKDGKDGFSGPTKMTVQQIWKKTNFDGTIPDPTIFKTVSATYSGVQFNAHVSNVLTEAITLTDFIGTKDPVYKMGEYAFPKPWCHASTPTDWATLADPFVGSATQKPFRGGYLLEVVSIHHPA
jgi:hypothetical protein